MVRIKKSFLRNKKLIIPAAVTVLIMGSYIFYLKALKTPEVTSTPSTSPAEDQRAAEEGVSQKNAGSTQSTSESDKQNNAVVTSGSVAAPQGNFVSNHRVGSFDSIESICTTTREATCNISFTLGNTTKSLGQKTVNQDGTASWVWTPSSIGLSVGSWQINATAILGSAQSSSKDPRNLEVL